MPDATLNRKACRRRAGWTSRNGISIQVGLVIENMGKSVMPNRGKLLICGILFVGLIAASVAWWYQHQQGQRILQLWGPQAAYRIRMAPKTELLQLAPLESTATDLAEPLVIAETSYRIRNIMDMSQRPGLVHARQALIQDASYVWDARPDPTSSSIDWQWALRFTDSKGTTLLAFDLTQGIICHLGHDAYANIRPIREGLRTYFQEQTVP